MRHAAAKLLRAVARVCADCAAQLDQSVMDLAPVETEWPVSEQWRIRVDGFLLCAEMQGADGRPIGFSFRRMDLHGVCTRSAWDSYTGVLVEAGVLVKVPRIGTGYAVRRNGAPWYRQAVRHAVRAGELKLPCPNWPPPALLEPTVTMAQVAQHRPLRQLVAQDTAALGAGGGR